MGAEVAPIYEYGSGQPWTQRLGYDSNGDGKSSDRPLGVGRNTMHGPIFRQLLLRLTKAFPIALGGRVARWSCRRTPGSLAPLGMTEEA